MEEGWWSEKADVRLAVDELCPYFLLGEKSKERGKWGDWVGRNRRPRELDVRELFIKWFATFFFDSISRNNFISFFLFLDPKHNSVPGVLYFFTKICFHVFMVAVSFLFK